MKENFSRNFEMIKSQTVLLFEKITNKKSVLAVPEETLL